MQKSEDSDFHVVISDVHTSEDVVSKHLNVLFSEAYEETDGNKYYYMVTTSVWCNLCKKSTCFTIYTDKLNKDLILSCSGCEGIKKTKIIPLKVNDCRKLILSEEDIVDNLNWWS
jgi:hypothetical protein